MVSRPTPPGWILQADCVDPTCLLLYNGADEPFQCGDSSALHPDILNSYKY